MAVVINGTTGVSGVDGSASTPAYQGTDSNTGITFPAADTVAVATGGAEAMRINSSRNMLIGTTSSVAISVVNPKLQVEHTDYDASSVIKRNQNDTGGPTGHFIKSRGTTNGSNTVVQSGDTLGQFRFWGTDGTDPAEGASITAQVDGTPGNNDMPGRLIFSTTADGSDSPTERMRIDSSGNVGIGTSSPNSNSSRTTLTVSSASSGGGEIDLTVSGTTALRILTDGSYNTEFRNPQNAPLVFSTNNTERARINSSGNIQYKGATASTTAMFTGKTANNVTFEWGPDIGSSSIWRVQNDGGTGVYLTSGNTSWTANSDERIKDIIEPITDAANKVSTLRAVIGKYKTDADGVRRSFLIAQDVQAVLPEAVDVQNDEIGTLGIQYTDVIPLLVAAIKEQTTRIETLEAQNAAFEVRLAALENK